MIPNIYRSLGAVLYSWFLGPDLNKRICAWLTVGVVLTVPLFGSPPTYSLDPLYTDHRHHAYAAWALLNIGPAVFTTPISEWSFGALRPFVSWPTLPYLYPIGSLLLFVPFGVVNNTGLLPEPVVNMAMILLFGVGGVAATWLLYRALRGSYPPALVGVIVVLAAPLYVFWGLNGFFDTVAVAVALYGVRAYRRGNDGTALVTLVGGLSLHYRLWYLGPLALLVAGRYARAQQGVVDWRLGVAGVLGGGSLVSFILTIPGLLSLGRTGLLNENPIALTTGATPAIVAALVGALLVLAVVYSSESDPAILTTLALAIISVFALTQWSPWYPILLTPTLVLVNRRPSQVVVTIGFYWVTLVLGMLAANHPLLRFL